jgi:FMN hydrolase / 5-amino-6-(5-phospho-D-ribitylamino)uracil phosphatase
MMRIRAITLDLDDTLWPIEPVMVRAEQRLDEWLRRHCPRAAIAHPIDVMRDLRNRIAERNPDLGHDFSALRRLSLREALIPHGYDDTHVESAYEEFYAARNEVECYVDALPALERLADKFPLVSLTNGNADLDRIGIAHFFQFSIASRDFGMAKPAPGIFLEACSRLGVEPCEVLHVGDDLHLDVSGATKPTRSIAIRISKCATFINLRRFSKKRW